MKQITQGSEMYGVFMIAKNIAKIIPTVCFLTGMWLQVSTNTFSKNYKKKPNQFIFTLSSSAKIAKKPRLHSI